MEWALVSGRLLFSLIFIGSAIAGHFVANKETAGYGESRGMPAAGALVYLSGIWILAGGLMVAPGVWTYLGALMLVAHLLVAMFWVHHYWTDDDPMQRTGEMTNFMKSLSMAGGGLIIFAFYSNEALQQANALGWEWVGPRFAL